MLLEDACKEAGIPNEIGNDGFGVCDIGETFTLPIKAAENAQSHQS
jgi:hypothetical protein